MKSRPFLCALLLFVLAPPLSGAMVAAAEGRALYVLAGTFPMYLFTRNVVSGAENVTVDILVPPEMGCPHDYALTPADMEKIGKAHVFVANGLGMEEFLGEPMLRANPRIKVVDSSAGVDNLLEIGSEEKEEEHAHGHDHSDHSDHSGEKDSHDEEHSKHEEHHHSGTNPHLFASPRMAAEVVANIGRALAEADPAHAEIYTKNAETYAMALRRVAGRLESAGKRLRNRKIVTQHAVFDYLARDIGLQIVAVVEEHPGQEPSAAGMLQIVKAIRRAKAAVVFTEPQYPAKVGETIAREALVPVAVLDPVASGPPEAPLDHYQKVMSANIETLKRTLGYDGE